MIAAATRLGRAVRAVMAVAFAVVALVLACALALAWRLGQGPLDMGWAAQRIEAAANQPGEPTRLSVGRAFLRWGGFGGGAEQGLELRLEDVVIADLQGAPAATARRVDLTVSMGRLLLGQVVPRAVAAEGLTLGLSREADGRLLLNLGGGDPGVAASEEAAGPRGGMTIVETLAELARPVRRPGSRQARPDLQHVEELTSIRLDNAVLRLHDPALGTILRLEVLSMDLRRQGKGGVRGAAAAVIGLGPVRATVALRAELAPNGGTEVQLAFAPINPTAVQSAAMQSGATQPGVQAGADGLDTAVQGAATMQLDAALRPTGMVASLQSGGGRLRLAGAVIGFDSLALDLAAAWDAPGWAVPGRLTVSRARAVVHAPGGGWPTTVTMAGHVARGGAGFVGDVDATVDHLAFADIAGLWPKPLGGHVRPWLTENVTGGVARDGAMRAQFKVSPTLSEVAITSVDGSLRGDDVTVWWLRPAPPVEGIQAVLTFRDPEVLEVAVSSAHQGPVALSKGLIRFTGMADKDQFMALGFDLAGNVADVVALLRNPALPLLAKSPIPIRNPTGGINGHMTVNLPMRDVVPFEEVRIQTAARLTDLHLGGLVAGRDLDHAAVQMTAGSDGLHAAGRGSLVGVVADMTVDMDFRDGGPGQVVQKATATARLTQADLVAAGFGSGGVWASGSGVATAGYTRRRDGSGDIAVNADLRDAALALAGWGKAPGAAAELRAHLLLRGDRLAGVDQLSASGPGLEVQGHVGMVGEQPSLLVLDRMQVGATDAHGQVRFGAAGEPIRATMAGPMLDLSDALKRPGGRPGAQPGGQQGAQPGKAGPPWVADLQFDRVRLSPDAAAGLAGVVVHVENDGRVVSALTVSTGGPEQVRASIRQEGRGRRLALQSADGGGLLRAAGLLGSVQGGQLALDATYDDQSPAAPLAGTAELRNFQVRDAPVLGKLLQAVTIYGVLDALRGPGLQFSDLVLPFRYEAGVLAVTEGRAFSSSLGLTAKGRIDTGTGTIDMQGTVVPAYVLNSMLGRIPLLGRLFSNERGGGLVALDYGLHGPLANPAVSVNPLSALTPGFLRGLFHLFD